MWFDFEKFKTDIDSIDSADTNKEIVYSRILKYDIFEMIKRSYIMTGQQVLQSFKSVDPKGTMMANEKNLREFLMKITCTSYKVPDIFLQAIFFFFQEYSDTGSKSIDYSIFYNCFFKYANIEREPKQGT